MLKTTADTIAVIGAGVEGCAVAQALAARGRRVLLIDRADPATAGASFGNVGHIATEQVETLPSKQLLFGFWRELFTFDGALHIPARRVMPLTPWLARFVRAAFRQEAQTKTLKPLVSSGADSLQRVLHEIGRHDLLKRHGHYAIWLGTTAARRAMREAAHAARLEVRTEAITDELLHTLSSMAAAHSPMPMPAAGLWYPDSAHVVDSAAVARALAADASAHGAVIHRADVKHVEPHGGMIEIATDSDQLLVNTAVICAGAWSAAFLAPFGLRAPLAAERGYHVELSGHPVVVDAPVLYANQKIAITPLSGRLRASSYLEFCELESPPDPRKPARLRAKLRMLGYQCEPTGPYWMGPRPTLPDYLPGIGRSASGHNLLYAVGHQHLGLTLAIPTAEIIADLVAGRSPRFDIAALDLQRFGR